MRSPCIIAIALTPVVRCRRQPSSESVRPWRGEASASPERVAAPKGLGEWYRTGIS